jgi:hypothetical protein
MEMTPEFRSFEYALGLFTVLVGLAIADIALSVHRLMRHASSVKWDPVALMAVVYALLVAVGMWFDFWSIRDLPQTRGYFFYLSIIAELFVVFLLAAASLPDEAHVGADLRAYYETNRRYFWSLALVFQLIYYSHWVYFKFGLAHGKPDARDIVEAVFAVAAPVILLLVRDRRLHYIILIMLIATMMWDRVGSSLT